MVSISPQLESSIEKQTWDHTYNSKSAECVDRNMSQAIFEKIEIPLN